MKVNEIRNLTTEEITKKISDIKEEIFNLRFAKAQGTLEKPSKLASLRRELARCKTIIKERESKESEA